MKDGATWTKTNLASVRRSKRYATHEVVVARASESAARTATPSFSSEKSRARSLAGIGGCLDTRALSLSVCVCVRREKEGKSAYRYRLERELDARALLEHVVDRRVASGERVQEREEHPSLVELDRVSSVRADEASARETLTQPESAGRTHPRFSSNQPSLRSLVCVAPAVLCATAMYAAWTMSALARWAMRAGTSTLERASWPRRLALVACIVSHSAVRRAAGHAQQVHARTEEERRIEAYLRETACAGRRAARTRRTRAAPSPRAR